MNTKNMGKLSLSNCVVEREMSVDLITQKYYEGKRGQ